MSLRRVGSHRQVKSQKKASIIKTAMALGVIHPGGTTVSRMKLPLLHSFTQKHLGLEFDDMGLEKMLRAHIEANGGVGLSIAATCRRNGYYNGERVARLSA